MKKEKGNKKNGEKLRHSPVIRSFKLDFDHVDAIRLLKMKLDPAHESCLHFRRLEFHQFLGGSPGEESHVGRLVRNITRIIHVDEEKAQSEGRWEYHHDRLSTIPDIGRRKNALSQFSL